MAASSKSSGFLASQRFYLPEINLVQYRNTLATLFGLNEQQIAINTANDNLGNVYRQIIIEKEAYARYLKQLVAPAKPLTQIDIALSDKKHFDDLRIMNENISFISEQALLQEEMLLMFAHFFHLQEIKKDILILELLEAARKEQQLINQPNLMTESALPDITAAEQIADLEVDFLKKINEINIEIEETKIKLQEISRSKAQLAKAIQIQTRRVNQLVDQIQISEQRIIEIQTQTDRAIQRHMRIHRMIEEKKESQRREEVKLQVVKERKIQAQEKLLEFQKDIQSHADIVEEKTNELEMLSEQLRNPELSAKEREQLNIAYYEAETENFIHSMYAVATYQDNDEIEEVVKKLAKEESVVEEHIHLLKREIKDLKKQLFETETLIKDLNAKKTLLVEEHKKLLATHSKEEGRLKELETEFKKLEQQEALHYTNLDNFNKLKTCHEAELFLSSTLIAIAEKKPTLLNVLSTNKKAHDRSLQAIESMEMAIAKHTQTISQKQKLLNEAQPGSKMHRKLQLDIDKATKSLVNMRDKLQTQQTKEMALRDAVKIAQEEVDQANITHENIMHRLENIKLEINDLRINVQRNKEQAQQMESQQNNTRLSPEYRSHTMQYSALEPNNSSRPKPTVKAKDDALQPTLTKPRKT